MSAVAPDISQFVARYPEFGDVPTEYTSVVQAALDEAARSTTGVFYTTPEAASDAVMLKAAVLLSNSPYARRMRLTEASGVRYEIELARKQRSASLGRRVF